MDILEKCVISLEQVKKNRPLVHNITNYVTVNDCANMILAIGGSPIMADEAQEVEDMVSIASSLVINMGTLNERTVASMIKAGKKANELRKPVIFDPVGVGAGPYRNRIAERLLQEIEFTVIRGNMSEIKSLSGLAVQTKGVDSVADEAGGVEAAMGFAAKMSCIAAVTGKTDIITDGKEVCLIENGHPILTGITGTGCMTTALVGTFCGAENDYLAAASAGILSMGLAGEIAQKTLCGNEGIGTFRIRLFDTVYNLNAETMRKEGRIKSV
ncbi:MAG: Hydroxyethylthiazole kinase [Candidatus Dichloromethanomonas elyunquensis]|nr:MAG: Hydroxyethylthiazole kinase [Candidatus Dichloromethanomonas elyunquensis]